MVSLRNIIEKIFIFGGAAGATIGVSLLLWRKYSHKLFPMNVSLKEKAEKMNSDEFKQSVKEVQFVNLKKRKELSLATSSYCSLIIGEYYQKAQEKMKDGYILEIVKVGNQTVNETSSVNEVGKVIKVNIEDQDYNFEHNIPSKNAIIVDIVV